MNDMEPDMSFRDEERINSQIASSFSQQEVTSDLGLELSDDANLIEHNKQFTKLLKDYVSHFSTSSNQKEKLRLIVYWISVVILVAFTLTVIGTVIGTLVLLSRGKDAWITSLAALFSSLAAMMSAYAVIPKMIVEYLFNREEEKNLAEIIGKIQEYDSKIREKRE